MSGPVDQTMEERGRSTTARWRPATRSAPPGYAAIATYFALTYLFSWASMVPMAFVGAEVRQGEVWPSELPYLVGPALAAIAVTFWCGGLPDLRALAASALRWRVPVQWWLFALVSPFAFLALALLIAALGPGDVPASSEFGRFNSLPATVPLLTLLLITLFNGFGEEIGWRGYALPQLQRRLTPFAATLILTSFWAGWHIPAFFVLRSYRDLVPAGVVPFVIGLTAGAFVFTWLCNRSGGSVLIAVIWHGTYNFTSATEAANGLVAAVVSTPVMVLGFALAFLEWRAMRDGRPTVIGPLPNGGARGYWVTNHLANPFMRLLLRGPLGARAGGEVALIRYRGRRSGKRYEHPVEYVRDGTHVWILPVHPERKTWWHNLQGGTEVSLRLAGEEWRGWGVALDTPADRPAIAGGLAAYLSEKPHTRRALGVTEDSAALSVDDPRIQALSATTVVVMVDLGSATNGSRGEPHP